MPEAEAALPSDPTMTALLQVLTAKDVGRGAAEVVAADWDDLVSQALRHGLAPVLFKRLQDAQCIDLLPAASLHTLQHSYLRTSMDNLRLYGRLAPVLRRFEAEGLGTIVLKGAFLTDVVYQDRGFRYMSDVDLLVRGPDLSRAASLLLESGWQQAPGPETSRPSGGHELPTFVLAGAQIDLHWSIEDDASPFRIDVDGLWRRARSVHVAGAQALGLAPEDLLLHLCLHTSYAHGWLPFSGGLRQLWDIASTIRHYGSTLHWDDVAARGQAWGIGACAWLTLLLAKELVGAPVPPQALRRLAPGTVEPQVLEVARYLVLHPHHIELSRALPALATVWLAKRWHDRPRLARARAALLPPPEQLAAAYPSLRAPGLTAARHLAHWRDLARDVAVSSFTRQARSLRKRERQRAALIRWLESSAASPSSTFTYRRGTPRDCAAVAHVNVESWRKSFAGLRPPASLMSVTVPQRTAMYRQRFEDDVYSMFVAEDGRHQVVGFADVGPAREKRWHCDAELYAIYILKEFQGRGIGETLFSLALAAAVARGMNSLCVIVLQDSPYRRFYEKLHGDQIFERSAEGAGSDQAYVVYAWHDLRTRAHTRPLAGAPSGEGVR